MKTSARISKSGSNTKTHSPGFKKKEQSGFFSQKNPGKPFFGPATLQPKLEIGQQDEPHESETLKSPRLKNNKRFQAVFENKSVIEYGDLGSEVRRIQQMLIDLGYSLPEYGADGIFGSETEQTVVDFQADHPPLFIDGRVGFATIRVIDDYFPSFEITADLSEDWTIGCVLEIMCPWNSHIIENILPGFTIYMFDDFEIPQKEWTGSGWVDNPMHPRAYHWPAMNEIGFRSDLSCNEAAIGFYHEAWHAQQPPRITHVTLDREIDAFIQTEQWSIDIGIAGQVNESSNSDVKSIRSEKNGQTEVDEELTRRHVSQRYGGASEIPGETIHSKTEDKNKVRVRRADGTFYERYPIEGEIVPFFDDIEFTEKKELDIDDWTCD
jgi:hypothetical protein